MPRFVPPWAANGAPYTGASLGFPGHMKQATHTIAVAALGACLSGCGGGTLAGIDGGAGSPGAGAGGFWGHGGLELGTAGASVEPCFFRPPPPLSPQLCGNGLID